MDQLKIIILLCVAGCASEVFGDTFGTGTNQFSIDFVEIGAVGNELDSLGFGAVDHSYRMGTYEVSVDQFSKAFSADSRIGDGDEEYWNDGTRTVGSGAPVSLVSWYEAAKFANWLTTSNAYAGAYQFDTNGVLTAVDRAAAVLAYGTVYVLPSENEWYKVAYYKPLNNGSYSQYSNGADSVPARGTNNWNYSVWSWDYEQDVRIVDTVNPDPNFMWEGGTGGIEQNGTYDINGNIWEWCEDAFDGTLDNMDEGRVIRGGGYEVEWRHIRSDFRHDAFDPTNENVLVGFRVAAIPATESWLNVVVNGSGTVNVVEGWKPTGTNISVVASPVTNWLFMGWSGDIQSDYTILSTNLIMTGDKSIGVTFSDDADGDGLSNSEEDALGTDPRNSDSDGDTFDDGLEVANSGSPLVSDLWRVDYIRNNGSEYNLFPSNSVLDLGVGQAGFVVTNDTAWFSLQLAESTDLITWTNVGEEVIWSVPVDSSNMFYRINAGH